MTRARAAIQAARWPEAIEVLNQVLELPPTSVTQEAQEAAGTAHLRNGDPVRARAEFETYLQLFPFYRAGMFRRQKAFQKSDRLK